MIKYMLVGIFFLNSFLFGTVTLFEKKWSKGETFLAFLKENKIPIKLYYNLSPENKELTAEIITGVKYQILKDEKGNIKQVLIPVGEELELHIYKNNKKYFVNTLPIIYEVKHRILETNIYSSPYQDIINLTNNRLLANEFIQSYKKSINFKRDLRKGDKLVIIYTQKVRLGEQFGNPTIKASMIETKGVKHYIYRYKGRYYNAKGQEIESFFLSQPCKYTRISDRFTYKRWHPILHIYRAHLGIDFAAPIGTPVHAAANGTIIFAGRKGGYGNCIIIRHIDGYKTLYAHLKKFARSIRRGKYVKRGKTIGYVGTTGLSTGPHLHFGLYKNNHAINPANTIKISKSYLKGSKKKEFLTYIKKYNQEIKIALSNKTKSKKEKSFAYYMKVKRDNNLSL